MNKIIKKTDITNLVESTMKEAGLLKEGEDMSYMAYMDEEEMCEGEGCPDYMEEEEHMEEADAKPDYIDLDKDGDKEESMKKAAEDKEKMEESVEEKDIVTESAEKLAEEASKHNVISEGLKKELGKFNKIINYKY
jgi:hypothetical protein